MEEKVTQLLSTHIESAIALADQRPDQIITAGMRLTQSLLADGKILIAAHGRSYANGIHFLTNLLNRYEVERPPLPGMMLGSSMSLLQVLNNEGHQDQLFAREIQALGHANDVLLILTTSGSASSLVQAIHAAKDKNMDCVVLGGDLGGMLEHHLGSCDSFIKVPSQHTARILELQLVVLHAWCDIVDNVLFGQMSE